MPVSKRLELALKNVERALEDDLEEGLLSIREADNANALLVKIKQALPE